MHCPNCGLESSVNLKFCRGCGLALEEVSRIVTSHSTGQPAKEKSSEDRAAVRQVALTLFWSVVAIFIGATLAGLNKNRFHNEGIGFLASSIVIGAAIVACYGVLSPLWKNRAPALPSAAESTGPIEIASNEYATPRELPGVPDSVTENTTRELQHERAENKEAQ